MRRLTLTFLTLISLFMIGIALTQWRIITLPEPYTPFTAPDLRDKPWALTDIKLKVLDIEPGQCARVSALAGLSAKFKPDTSSSTNCHLHSTVQMVKLSQAAIKSEQTRCNIQARLYMWEKNVLQPASLHYFGEPIKEITHFGSYSCRTIAGSSMMSEHATANAFDISGFILKSGRMISLKKNWHSPARDAAFLRAARQGLCQYFNTTLSPDYNKAHEDHFHVDMGWFRSCR